MSRHLQGRANFATKHHHIREGDSATVRQDVDRSLKRELGEIHEIDPGNKGKLRITAWIRRPDGGRRLWGSGKEIILVDSPLDILVRFGSIRPGMPVEIVWRGISETGRATARIIGEAEDVHAGTTGSEIPLRDVDTQSSLPFEPFGLI